jgi:hypothetical protein
MMGGCRIPATPFDYPANQPVPRSKSMKVLVFVKATPKSEKGIVSRDEQMTRMFTDMGKFNEQLVAAGIMQEAVGL